jgi:hypothetical protein
MPATSRFADIDPMPGGISTTITGAFFAPN